MTAFDRLGKQIASEQDALRAHAGHRAAVRGTIDLLDVPVRAPRTRRVMFAGAGAFAALAAAAWLLLANRPAQAPLTAIAADSGAKIAAGAFIDASGAVPFALRFSDGSRVELAAHSRARLVAVDANGAHIALESGRASLSVTHRARASWRVSAGPFAVHVIGTRFDVQWNPEQDAFALDLNQGVVDVAGCEVGQGYRMHAGQRLEASCKHGRFDVSDGARSDGAQPAAVVPPPSSAAPVVAARTAAEVPASAGDVRRGPIARGGQRGSQRRAAAGSLPPSSRSGAGDNGNAPALRGGGSIADRSAAHALPSEFEARCAGAGADALAALADAARYAGDREHEAYAWRLLRRRFPGTPRAGLAAFALGRLEFDVHGSYPKAAEWFGTYLKEQPSGPLAREARGRLMEASLRAGDVRGARALASAYLRDYPSGPHAELARSLEQAPAP